MTKKTDLLAEAVADAKRVKELAIESAKNILVEQMAGKVEKLVSEALDDVEDEEKKEDTSETSEGISFAEGEKEDVLDLDELPSDEEEETEAMAVEAEKEDVAKAGEKERPEEKIQRRKAAQLAAEPPAEEVKLGEGDESEEEEEVSDEEVEEVYEELFGEVEIPPLDKKADPEDHLEEPEKKEKPFEEQTPPAAEDFVPKEAFNRLVKKAGRKLIEYRRGLKTLTKAVKETNLFNAKLLAVTELNRLSDSKDVREKIVEFIDRAQSIDEVERAKKGATMLLKQLTESKRVKKTPLNRSTSGAIPVLKGKPVVQENQGNKVFKRWKELSGVTGEKEKDNE